MADKVLRSLIYSDIFHQCRSEMHKSLSFLTTFHRHKVVSEFAEKDSWITAAFSRINIYETQYFEYYN